MFNKKRIESVLFLGLSISLLSSVTTFGSRPSQTRANPSQQNPGPLPPGFSRSTPPSRANPQQQDPDAHYADFGSIRYRPQDPNDPLLARLRNRELTGIRQLAQRVPPPERPRIIGEARISEESISDTDAKTAELGTSYAKKGVDLIKGGFNLMKNGGQAVSNMLYGLVETSEKQAYSKAFTNLANFLTSNEDNKKETFLFEWLNQLIRSTSPGNRASVVKAFQYFGSQCDVINTAIVLEQIINYLRGEEKDRKPLSPREALNNAAVDNMLNKSMNATMGTTYKQSLKDFLFSIEEENWERIKTYFYNDANRVYAEQLMVAAFRVQKKLDLEEPDIL
jgi:hypothetical protein